MTTPTQAPDVADETYYTKGKDAEYFEKLPDKDFVWALTCAAQDLNDSDENVSQWMPVGALLVDAGNRIVRLLQDNETLKQGKAADSNVEQALERDLMDARAQRMGAENALAAAQEQIAAMRETAKDALSHLVAATSLLERSPKKAAPSNKMFDQMVADYKASIERVRSALAIPQAPAKMVERNATNDQIARVMLEHGTDEQKRQALAYAGITPRSRGV